MVTEALEYWRTAIGINYVMLSANQLPRVLVRSGTDGLGGADARGGIDGTDSSNWATSALIVIRPETESRTVYRHEMGHALGFLGHSATGLMAAAANTDVLTDRERRMMLALYSIPAGSSLEADGTWRTPAGETGVLADVQAARDIIDLNMNAPSFRSARRLDVTCRWALPVPVYVEREQ